VQKPEVAPHAPTSGRAQRYEPSGYRPLYGYNPDPAQTVQDAAAATEWPRPHRQAPMLGWLYALSFKHFEDLFARDVPVYAQVPDLSYGCM